MMGVYSYHTFIFPFSWITDGGYYEKFVKYFDRNRCWENTDIEDSDDISVVGEASSSRENKEKLYNEYQYFTPYARKAIYGLDEKIVRNYSFMSAQVHNKAEYRIKKEALDYSLSINAIRLKIYNTGVALLIFECENEKYRNIEDVKNINDYGRRVTLPFISESGSIAADSLEVKIGESISFKSALRKFNLDKNRKISMNHVGDFIKDILDFGGLLPKTFSSHKVDDPKRFRIFPLLGDRMCVLSLIADPKEVGLLKQKPLNDQVKNSLYELVYVDRSRGYSCANDRMRDELLHDAYYDRWEGMGSFYYITNYSFVCITEGYFQPTIDSFITQYYQMFCLAIAQRASIVVFKKDIAWISGLFRRDMSGAKKNKSIDRITEMAEKYIAFESQLYFDEVSPEQQGIEIYDYMKKSFRLKEETDSLKEQIDSLYNVANIRSSNMTNNMMTSLTWVAFVVSIASMLLAILQLQNCDIPDISDWRSIYIAAVVIFIISLCFSLVSIIAARIKNHKNR